MPGRFGHTVVDGQDRGSSGVATQHVADGIGYADEDVRNGSRVDESECGLRSRGRELVGLDDDREPTRAGDSGLGQRAQSVGVHDVRAYTFECLAYLSEVRRGTPASGEHTRVLAPPAQAERE